MGDQNNTSVDKCAMYSRLGIVCTRHNGHGRNQCQKKRNNYCVCRVPVMCHTHVRILPKNKNNHNSRKTENEMNEMNEKERTETPKLDRRTVLVTSTSTKTIHQIRARQLLTAIATTVADVARVDNAYTHSVQAFINNEVHTYTHSPSHIGVSSLSWSSPSPSSLAVIITKENYTNNV